MTGRSPINTDLQDKSGWSELKSSTSTERPDHSLETDQTEVAGVNVVGASLKKREASSVKLLLDDAWLQGNQMMEMGLSEISV